MRPGLFTVILLSALASASCAAEESARRDTAGNSLDADVSLSEVVVNNHDIEPLMLLHCTVCHGVRRQEAGLDLRTRQSMLKGGKSGPAMVPGNPDESLLLQRARAGEMPPKKREVEAGVRQMSQGELDLLTQWIAQGAPASRSAARCRWDQNGSSRQRRGPPSSGRFSHLNQSNCQYQFYHARILNPQSAILSTLFILRKLEANGLSPSPEADRLTLIRRVHFDLTGLPPEPEEVKRFLADPDPLAYEKLIDRLLVSPRYGERWGRYWLDLTGYADWPHAYRYRDYVIRSFNADKRYDRFLLEQLAGDELVNTENVPVVTQQSHGQPGGYRFSENGSRPNRLPFVELCVTPRGGDRRRDQDLRLECAGSHDRMCTLSRP